jgi:hypothetical protein
MGKQRLTLMKISGTEAAGMTTEGRLRRNKLFIVVEFVEVSGCACGNDF